MADYEALTADRTVSSISEVQVQVTDEVPNAVSIRSLGEIDTKIEKLDRRIAIYRAERAILVALRSPVETEAETVVLIEQE